MPDMQHAQPDDASEANSGLFELARHNTAAWLQSIDHATRINLQGIAVCVHWRDACVDAWQNIAKVETAAAWEAGRPDRHRQSYQPAREVHYRVLVEDGRA